MKPKHSLHWDLRHARTFIVVAETLNFSAAARVLHVTQSAVSRTVARMEQDLNVPLLTRTTRNVELTAEGRLLLEECRAVVAQFDHWLRRARSVADGLAGELLVGCNDFAIQSELLSIVKEFRTEYPGVTIRFRSAAREDQMKALNSGELDLAFVMGPISNVCDARHSSLFIGFTHLNVMMPHDHPFAAQESVHIEQLRGQPIILGERHGWQTYLNLINLIFDEAQIEMNLVQEINESIAIFALVSAGMGLTIYPECSQHRNLLDVTCRPLAGTERLMETHAVWLNAGVSQATQLFTSCIEAYRRRQAPILKSRPMPRRKTAGS